MYNLYNIYVYNLYIHVYIYTYLHIFYITTLNDYTCVIGMLSGVYFIYLYYSERGTL